MFGRLETVAQESWRTRRVALNSTVLPTRLPAAIPLIRQFIKQAIARRAGVPPLAGPGPGVGSDATPPSPNLIRESQRRQNHGLAVVPGRRARTIHREQLSSFKPALPPQLLLLLDLHPGRAEGLQVRGDSPRLVEVVGCHLAVAALMLQREGAEPVEFAGEVAHLSLQLAVRRAEVVAFRLDGLDLFALPRATFCRRELVLLAEALRFAVDGRRAGGACLRTAFIVVVTVSARYFGFAVSSVGGVARPARPGAGSCAGGCAGFRR